MSSLFTIESKVHDESRQGEAYSPIIESQANFKKLFYVECYGC